MTKQAIGKKVEIKEAPSWQELLRQRNLFGREVKRLHALLTNGCDSQNLAFWIALTERRIAEYGFDDIKTQAAVMDLIAVWKDTKTTINHAA